jgi:molybdenum cofactor cytidylyltransferase
MICGILLAAGRSQRMGQPKLLLPWQGTSLVRHVAQIALGSQLDQLVVVVGHRAAHVRAGLEQLPVRIVENEDFLDGQSTSVRAGIIALGQEVKAAVVLLADQPLLQSTTIDRLIDAFLTDSAPVVVPRYKGQRGNPILFSRELFDELMKLKGDQGARSVLATYADRIKWIDVADEGVLLDIDTPDMYQQLAEREERRNNNL